MLDPRLFDGVASVLVGIWGHGGEMLYIALLRGINVGGHTVKMERLRALLTDLGLANVRTYIQSGNVFFESDRTDSDALAQEIATHLAAQLGYAVPTMLRSVEEVEQHLARNPFAQIGSTPDNRFCIVFTDTPIPADLALPAVSPKGDMEIVGMDGRDAFVVWHLIGGRPPASSAETWLARTLGGRTTTRFFHTTAKILEAAKKG